MDEKLVRSLNVYVRAYRGKKAAEEALKEAEARLADARRHTRAAKHELASYEDTLVALETMAGDDAVMSWLRDQADCDDNFEVTKDTAIPGAQTSTPAHTAPVEVQTSTEAQMDSSLTSDAYWKDGE